jgi:hypothetical protein
VGRLSTSCKARENDGASVVVEGMEGLHDGKSDPSPQSKGVSVLLDQSSSSCTGGGSVGGTVVVLFFMGDSVSMAVFSTGACVSIAVSMGGCVSMVPSRGVSVSMGGLGAADSTSCFMVRLGAARDINGAGVGDDGSMAVGLPVVPTVMVESSTVMVTPWSHR